MSPMDVPDQVLTISKAECACRQVDEAVNALERGPRGSKNRYPRRPRGSAVKWTRHDWAVVYRRAFHETDGDAGQKHAVVLSECQALWLLHANT
jgi:hypothetical protein